MFEFSENKLFQTLITNCWQMVFEFFSVQEMNISGALQINITFCENPLWQEVDFFFCWRSKFE